MEPAIQNETKVSHQNSTKITTIKLSDTTKSRIEHLKLYPRETYDEILQRILNILNASRQNPEKARSQLIIFDRQRQRNFGFRGKK